MVMQLLSSLPSMLRASVSTLLPTTPEGASAGAELVTSDGRALPLEATTLRAEARGGLARFVLEQVFHNAHAETLHVTYRMPLPADGAVSGYAFEIDGRVITGVVDRKAAARERYEQAIVSGRTAALLEQDRADIFTQRIGNLPAGERLTARIAVDARLVWLPEGEWELRFPTVIGPRYIGSADTAADVVATHVKVADRPLAVTVQLALTIGDAIIGGRAASSPTHALVRGEDGALRLAPGARLDRDLVVRWPVADASVGLSLATARPMLRDGEPGDAFGLLTVVPPARAAGRTPVARDLLVLLDTSGSMDGGPLDKAKQVVAMMIDSLTERDRLELIEFSSAPRRYQAEAEHATPQARAAAIRWVKSRQASGGTEMRAAVIEALATLRIGAQRQVLVVTDGYIGGEQQILEVLHARLPRSCRLHVLGVGSAVNRSLATALARAGRGAEVLVGLDEDAERGARRLLDRTRAPMLTNVEITGSAVRGHAPAQVPDVFEGAPLMAALTLAPEGGELVVRGDLADDRWEQRIAVPPTRVGDGSPAVAALYARERVADLEARAPLGETSADIEAIGLRFQIATRLTSWVAVDDARTMARGSRTELVPQELPYGTSATAIGLRSAAAPLVGGTMAGTVSRGAAAMMEEIASSWSRRAVADRDEADDHAVDAPDAFDAEEATGSHVLSAASDAATGGGPPAAKRAQAPVFAASPARAPVLASPPPAPPSAPPPAQHAAPPLAEPASRSEEAAPAAPQPERVRQPVVARQARAAAPSDVPAAVTTEATSAGAVETRDASPDAEVDRARRRAPGATATEVSKEAAPAATTQASPTRRALWLWLILVAALVAMVIALVRWLLG